MMEMLFENALRGSVVLILALIAVGLGRRRSAAFRHRVLSAAVAAALAMPALMTVAPAWEWPGPAMDGTVGSTGLSVAFQAAEGPTASGSQRIDAAGAGLPGAGLRAVALAVWSAGFLAAAGSLATGFVRLGRITRRSRPLHDETWVRCGREIARRYGLSRAFRLLESRESSHLMTWGILHPRVVVPCGAGSWPETRVRAVLGHELAHLRRYDWPLQLLAECLSALYWFNPLVWIACRRLRAESERACDDAAICQDGGGSEYARHLVDLARTLYSRRAPSLAFAGPGVSAFERRVGAILDTRTDRRPVSRLALTAIAGGGLALGLLAAGCGSPRSASVQDPGPSAVIAGRVFDRTGALVPGVELKLYRSPVRSSPAQPIETAVISNEAGAFRFGGVAPGDYRLTAGLPGFRLGEQLIADLAAGEERETAFTLEVAGGSSDISVTALRPSGTALSRGARGAAGPPPPPPAQPVRIGGNVARGQLISRVDPEYPGDLRDQGVEGVVILEATIAADGTVQNIRALTGPSGLRQAARDAVAQWRYRPFMLNGVAVDTETTITVNFTLEDPD